MKYLPFENITYKTRLDSEEILKRLTDITEPKRPLKKSVFFGSSNHKAYEGSIDVESFNIIRIIGYRNSFLPRIKGNIEKGYSGTKINVKMKLSPFVIAFMFIWFGGVGISCFAVLTLFSSRSNFDPTKLIPFAMLVFGYAIVTGGFKYESIKTKKYFAELFEAKYEE